MREIKFRAWDKEEKKMVDLKDDKYNIRTSWEGKLYLVNTDIADNDGYDYQMEVEFLEHTGIKDKNDKEIYDGDIVRLWGGGFPGKEYKAIVSFECAGFILTSIDNKETDYIGSVVEDQDLEVIGNIYENLELLEG